MSGRFEAGSSSTSRRFVMAAATALAVGLSFAALAFACSPQATISVTPTQVQPGDRATVSGFAFAGAVQVRWGGASGPLLAAVTPEGQSFVATVTIPDVAPNAYVVVATARDASGAVVGQSSAAVEVVARPAAAPPASSGPTTAAAGQPPAAADATSAAPATSQPAATTGAPAASKPAAARKPTEGAAAPVRSATHGSGARRPAATSQSRDRTPLTASSRPAVRESTRSQTATPATRGSGRGRATATATAKAVPQRPAGSLGADRPTPARQPASAAAAARPSLISPVDPAALHAGRSDSRLAIGLGMLAISVNALLGSFAVAEARRRRVPVGRRRAG